MRGTSLQSALSFQRLGHLPFGLLDAVHRALEGGTELANFGGRAQAIGQLKPFLARLVGDDGALEAIEWADQQPPHQPPAEQCRKQPHQQR